jgi:hypothetical protein
MATVFLGIFETILLAIIFIAGVTLLIFGLIFKKKGLWIPGIIVSAMTLLTGIIMLIIFFIGVNRSSSLIDNPEYYPDNEYYNNQDDGGYEEIPQTDTNVYISEKTDSILALNFGLPVSSFLQDNNNNSYLIKIYPDKFMSKRGIKLLSFTKTAPDTQQNGISLKIVFQKKFKGKFMLEIYGKDDYEMVNSVVEVSQEAGKTTDVEFDLHKVLYMEDVYYCTLTAFE